MHETQVQRGMAAFELLDLLFRQLAKKRVFFERPVTFVVFDRFLQVLQSGRHVKFFVRPKE